MAFDIRNPTLSGMSHVSLDSNLQTYREIWHKETLVTYIDEGADGLTNLRDCVSILRDFYERIDVFELRPAAVRSFEAHRITLDFVHWVVHDSAGIEFEDIPVPNN